MADASLTPLRLGAAKILIFSCCFLLVSSQYQPNWKSIDSRPLPAWYDEAKFGIFMHWGVFSVPSFGSEWFWWHWQGDKNKAYVDFMTKNYPPSFTYADFAREFKAEFFDPNKWADILAASGAKYLVLTSKHHEGYTNWPSAVSWNWNSMDVGPKRDLVGDLAAAVRDRTDIRFGLYHSLFEWFNPLYLADKTNKFKTNNFVMGKTLPELYEIVNKYKPEVIWSDGDWEAPDVYWNSTEFIAWLYNKSPVKDSVVTNDRWGSGIMCHHGGYLTCQDKYNPGVLQKRKWENAMTVDRSSWGYRREAQLADLLTMEEIIKTLAETVSCGGNLLMNIGPTADGRIIPAFEERLRQTGDWLKVNGEAIYSSKPWSHQNDTVNSDVWYTSRKHSSGTSVYAIVLKWSSPVLSLGAPKPDSMTKVSLLGYPGTLSFDWRSTGGIDVKIPAIPANKMPSQWGWVFKLDNLANSRSNRIDLY